MDLDGSRLWVLRTIQRSWFEIKTQRELGTCFENHLGLKNDRIVLGREINGIKSKNGFNLLGHNVWIAPKWREGFWEILPQEVW